jgi:hypothetical protein
MMIKSRRFRFMGNLNVAIADENKEKRITKAVDIK